MKAMNAKANEGHAGTGSRCASEGCSHEGDEGENFDDTFEGQMLNADPFD